MSNDLISRSALMQSLRNNVLVDVTSNLEQAITEQPTAYDVDKVVERLRKELDDCTCEECDSYLDCDTCKAERAVKIVKSGGIE